jgi:hypothetical protein
MERASAGISMNFVEIMLGEKLKDADPALDIMGCRFPAKTSLITLNFIGT